RIKNFEWGDFGMRTFVVSNRWMSHASNGQTSGVVGAHVGTAGAVIVQVSYRSAVVERFGGSFGGRCGGHSAGDEVVRKRGFAGDALGIEWAGDIEAIRLGSKGIACVELQVSLGGELVAAVG